jgi:hypothetical protein
MRIPKEGVGVFEQEKIIRTSLNIPETDPEQSQVVF